MAAPTLVKKYANRRLYDTSASRYITLEGLAEMIRAGTDVVVEDAHTGRDLTQETLTQIILDRGNGRILPTSLLVRLIRLDDEALAEFLTRYVGWSLEVYLQAKQRARALLPVNPFATAPFAATDALARLVLGASPWGAPPPPAPERPHVPEPPPFPEEPYPPPPSPGAPDTSAAEEMARLRREIEELKRSVGAKPAKRAARKPRKR